jgi:hypothetical protein
MTSLRWGAAAALVVVVAVMGTATAGTGTQSTDLDLIMNGDEGVGVTYGGINSMGDRIIQRSLLYEGETQVGRSFQECVVVSAKIVGATKGLWRCSYILELPDGDLLIEGLDPRGVGTGNFAIVGGTEAYRTARGDAVLTDTTEHTEVHLHIES